MVVASSHVRLKAVVVREASVGGCSLKRSHIAIQSLKSRSVRILAQGTRRNVAGKRRGQRLEGWISVKRLKEGRGVVAHISHFDDRRIADSILNTQRISLRIRIAEIG